MRSLLDSPLLQHVMLLVAPQFAVGSRPWPNSSVGIHRFGLWANEEKNSFNGTPGNISNLDFVWSMEFEELPRFRPAMSSAVLSKYIAFSLNNHRAGISTNLSWWQEHHPSWVLYRCDRKTPATYVSGALKVVMQWSTLDVAINCGQLCPDWFWFYRCSGGVVSRST